VVAPETHALIERAKRLYEDRLRGELEKSHMNEFVVIEPDSGDYFLGKTMGEASAAAQAAHPGRRGYIIRVGHEVAIHMGVFLIDRSC
jgi:hypothetical protein